MASAAHHCHVSATHTHFSGDVFQGPDRRAVTGTLPGNLAWGRSVSSMGLPLSFTGWFSGRGLALDLGTQVSPEGISSWMARCTPCVCVRVRVWGMRKQQPTLRSIVMFHWLSLFSLKFSLSPSLPGPQPFSVSPQRA